MRKIESYTELSRCIMAQFRRGMVTNAFLSREEYEAEIVRGNLWITEAENGLLVIRQRTTHRMLNFWLNDGFVWDDLPIPPDTVVEIAHRERDTALIETVRRWKNAGFVPEFRRMRMVCGENCAQGPDAAIWRASAEDFETARRLLDENFSPMTGCLPTDDTLAKDIADGQVLLYERNGAAAGLLHFTADKKKTELRHLCVTEAVRGLGIGRKLVQAYGGITNGMTRHVWVRTDNLPAIQIYENCGYSADGMTSDVLIRR